MDLSPDEATTRPGTTGRVTATVFDAAGNPMSGVAVDWDSEGVGEITQSDAVTDENGHADAILESREPGDQQVSASVASCGDSSTCSDSAVKHWGPDFCDVFGTRGSDVLDGADKGETLCAFGGNDTILGRGGPDVIVAGRGNDRLFGGGGRDLVSGGAGADEIRGGRGRDRLDGRSGADFLASGPGRDLVLGGRGKDRCVGYERGETTRSCDQ